MPKKTKKKKASKPQKVEAKRVKRTGRGGALSTDDIEKAFELYCDKVSIRQIAQKLCISATTLYKYKKSAKWADRKDRRLAKAADKADDKYAVSHARHINISQALQKQGIESLKTKAPVEMTMKETRLCLVEGVRLERELLGQVNTDIKIVVLFPPELMDI